MSQPANYSTAATDVSMPHHSLSDSVRKRPAESEIDPRPAHRPATTTTTTQLQLQDQVAAPGVSINQSRKVLAPGATQAAFARLAELKAQGTITTTSPSPPPPSQSHTHNATTTTLLTTTTTSNSSSGKKTLAPGATQAALARLATTERPSNMLHQTGVVGGYSQHLLPTPSPILASGDGPKKVLAPGATQAALARLASMKASSGPVLPPPPRPLFSPADYSVGTVVWAKMMSYPWWPAQVQKPSQDQMRLRHSSSDHFVVFYGSADYTWLPMSDLKPFRVNTPDYARLAGSKNKGLQRAIDEAYVSLGQRRPDVLGKLIM